MWAFENIKLAAFAYTLCLHIGHPALQPVKCLFFSYGSLKLCCAFVRKTCMARGARCIACYQI